MLLLGPLARKALHQNTEKDSRNTVTSLAGQCAEYTVRLGWERLSQTDEFSSVCEMLPGPS